RDHNSDDGPGMPRQRWGAGTDSSSSASRTIPADLPFKPKRRRIRHHVGIGQPDQDTLLLHFGLLDRPRAAVGILTRSFLRGPAVASLARAGRYGHAAGFCG